MSIKFNNTEIPSTGVIKFNGTKLDTVISNNVTVWGGSTPYSITDFTKYDWSYSCQDGSVNEYQISQNLLKVQAKKDPNSGSFGQTRLTATLPTGGCNKMKVEYYAYDGFSSFQAITASFGIYNTDSIYQAERRTIIFDISGDTINFQIYATDATEYFTAVLEIYSIEFYNE